MNSAALMMIIRRTTILLRFYTVRRSWMVWNLHRPMPHDWPSHVPTRSVTELWHEISTGTSLTPAVYPGRRQLMIQNE